MPRTCRLTSGSVAATWASVTGRTGSVSRAPDRPRFSPVTAWIP
jgi:hypothetical protein